MKPSYKQAVHMMMNITVSLFFQPANIKNVTFEKLHIWQNNTYIKQIEKRYGAAPQLSR